MDTGAGWSGVLTIMNIETKEFFTSDPVPVLYPGIEGRKRK
jgi:serine/threonine protein phosphatase 1